MEEIIEILKENSKVTPQQIAVMLDMDEEEVIKKIKEIEEKKIIIRYGATVNWDKTDKEMVSAMIEVKVIPQRGVGFDDVAERIYRFPEVRSVYLMSGGYDLLVEVVGNNLKEIAYFVSEKLATLDYVQGTMTNFILKKYKEDGVIFEEEQTAERLKVSL